MGLSRLKSVAVSLLAKGSVRRRFRALLASLCGAGLLCVASACGPTQTPPSANVPEGPTIAIAVPNDEPGLSLDHEGKYSGFDVEVAHYVAQKLGYAQKQIVFKPVTVSSAVATLEQSKADMFVSALPAATASSAGRQFGTSKPYLTNPLGLMVPTRLQREFTDISSLQDRSICTVKGTVDGSELTSAVPFIKIQERETYPQCLTALLSGEANAVAADVAILHGLASSVVERDVTVLGDGDSASSASSASLANAVARISQVPHAIMIRPSDGELTKKIDAILSGMAKDGTWCKAADTMRKDIGYSPEESLNAAMMRR
ncbi:transporter substrate-binding domain-containing protein [Bifidobacterium sp. ESL0775]|uniref:substrate-binding periplasmic protein n=1 Tax=Bifidobacterium sp. ESL0775 TaxID=2983230 RepID=UPI0023F6BDEF|nr:transporter substrate-binding domain-containing protein [Bifidobacterium sp. ESL0775]WEV68510.1 transporter substrate-binding domain-containing protein [Bifidobacterium sp. ESL0775]